MKDELLDAILDVVQVDVGGRGLRAVPHDNLVTRTGGDFQAACHSLANAKNARILVVTGFTIPSVVSPSGETDGPLGALFLARALTPLGYSVTIATDGTTVSAIRAGLAACQLPAKVLDLASIDRMPMHKDESADFIIALERVGPSHSDGRCYSMRGRDMTDLTPPAHLYFENPDRNYITIGIGDGGNEMGMGKIPWQVISANIPNGDRVACRVPTDYLIVAGVSNWGAYALAAGVRLLRGAAFDPELFSVEHERELLQLMVDTGPLVDGLTGQRAATVDGLTFDQYSRVLSAIGRLVGASS